MSEDAQQIEVVLARDYNKGLSVFHNSTFYSLNTSYGRPGLTRKIVASYLMADGTRFTDKAGWETMEFRDECQNRDPRLAQSIRTPGYTRINSTKVEVPSLSTCMTGYQPIKFVAPADFGSDAGRHRPDDQEAARPSWHAQSGHGPSQRQPRPVPFGP